MEQNDLRQADLVEIFGSRERVSEVVNGKRAISKSQAKALGEFFNADFHGAKLCNILGKASQFLLGKSQNSPIKCCSIYPVKRGFDQVVLKEGLLTWNST
jgi:hypothetical protein